MTAETRVPIDLLRDACDVVLARLAEDRDEIVVSNAHFWSIPKEDLFDLSKVPDSPTVGDVSDLLDNVRMLVDEPETSMRWALVWLGDILRVVGMEAPSSRH